jgi:hypothetical protein
MTKEWCEERLKQLEQQLITAELTKAAVDGAIQECQYHLDQFNQSSIPTKTE